MKTPFTSKTILFNSALTLWALYQYTSGTSIPPLLVLGCALGNIWLRAITRSPLRWNRQS